MSAKKNKVEKQEPLEAVIPDASEACEEKEQETIGKPEDDLQKSNADLKDRLHRTLAEFDNFRKRTVKEKSSMYDDGVRDTIEKLLPAVDNFERALSSVEDKDNNFYKGVEMLLRQLQGILGEIGVESIEAVGHKFNTDYHFAVAHVQDENVEENEVIEELQKGYKYKNKVVRASMVKVAN